MRRCLVASLLGSMLAAVPAPAGAEALRLAPDPPAAHGKLEVGVMKPFDVFLVAERDSTHREASMVAYKLEVGDGLVVAGEELLVESLLGLGSSRTGMHLAFRCIDDPKLRVLRFRVVATKPVEDAKLALRPEGRTNFLGLVACRAEDFAKFTCSPDSVLVSAR